MRDRIYRYLARPLQLWNGGPGAPYLMLDFSDTLLDFPFFYGQLGAAPVDRFTAVLYATSPVISSSPLFRLLKNVARSAYVHKVSWCGFLLLLLLLKFRMTDFFLVSNSAFLFLFCFLLLKFRLTDFFSLQIPH